MRRVIAGLLALVVTAACADASGGDGALEAGVATTTTVRVLASSTTTGSVTPPTLPTSAAAPPARTGRTTMPAGGPRATSAPAPAPATPTPVTTGPPPATEPFQSSVLVIDDAIAARMTASWRPGCPVALADLRLVTVSHWGFDGSVRAGELVVHVQAADPLVAAFERLFRSRFPIERMRLVDEYGGDDDRSMADNNTSAFNCRPVAGSARWSEHAFGSAIDINPVQNPYVTRSGVSPPAGAAFTTRTAATPGLITRDGPVVAAFGAIGWGWGGSWSSGKDYQHFSASGR